MAFKISLTDKLPEWDIMSVAKLKNFPLEKADYKPFVQVRCCAVENGEHEECGLGIKFTVFEVIKRRESRVSAYFCGKNDETKNIAVTVGATGEIAAENGYGKIDVGYKFFEGEDLQGIYWGAEVFINRKYISFWDDIISGEVRGNYYKTSRKGEKDNFGSFYPCDFEEMAGSDLEDSPENTILLLPKGNENVGEFYFRRY
ncbi:MAG: hypothetical protein J5874_06965 [Oscillospiraceae bacterium]|nr:hypothetical protein [Oscillospiraceae bacterium]